jgi:hypothetical protein
MHVRQHAGHAGVQILSAEHRRAIPFVACALAIGASLTAGIWISANSTVATIPIAPPTIAPVPTMVWPHVRVTVAEPMPTRKPIIDKRCIDWPDPEGKPASCDDGSGFPAISGDGTQIVDAVVPDDGGRGFPGLMIVFIDAKTSKTRRSVFILSPGEYDPGTDPPSPGLRAKVGRRITTVQAELDAQNYRSMYSLGETTMPARDVVSGDETRVYAEWHATTLHMIDPVTRDVIGRHEFSGNPGSTQYCGYLLQEIAAWWDPTARIVFGRMSFHTGDLCGEVTIEQVFAI